MSAASVAVEHTDGRGMFAALQSVRYRWYLGGQAITSVGAWMQRIAQDWLVLQVTGGDAVALGITTACQFLPFLLLAPVSGVIADRYPRRRVLMITSTVGAVTAGVLTVLALAGAASVAAIYLTAFLLGSAAAIDHPTRQAFLGDIVEPTSLANAVALNSAAFNLSRIVGPALAGVMIAALGGVAGVFAVNALSFVVAVATLQRIRIRGAGGVDARERVTFRAGLSYLADRRDLLLVLLAVAIAATFAFNFATTTALMAAGEFEVGAAAFGVMGTALSCGSIVGSLLAARRRSAPSLRLVLASGIAFGLLTMMAGLMPSYAMFLVVLPLCGLGALTFSVAAQSYLQTGSAGRMRGRVMGIYALVFFGGNPVGGPLLGWVSNSWGPRWGLVGGGLA
ncbi:MAG: MFS transporter, partial [Candidatus Nanopelagicales bacterium]